MKNRKLKVAARLGTLIAVIVLLVFIGFKIHSKNTQEGLEAIQAKGKLRVATEKSRTGFILGNNKAEGFNYEMVKAFADSKGLKLEINVVNNLDSAISGLLHDRYDLIACNIPNTTEIKKKVNLSVPFLNSRQMLIQRKANDSLPDDTLIVNHYFLANQKIYLAGGSPFKMRLKNLSNEISDTIQIVELESVTSEKLVKAVSDGKIRFTICDELQARKLSEEYQNIDYSLPVGFNQQYSWAVNKKSLRLLQDTNEFLNHFLQSDDYWNIFRKYY